MNKKLDIPFCETCETRENSLFCNLSTEELEGISLEKSCNFYKSGQFVFVENSHAAGLYCVHTGKVKLYKLGADGNEQIIRLVKEGDILGYRALISGEPYFGTAAAIGDCVICFIPKHKFFELLTTKTDISQKVMRLLSRDLKSAERKIMTLAHKSVRERLAETLFMFKEFFGVKTDGVTIKSNLTREEIANFIGTATETAIRILSEFKEEKLIDIDGKEISILRPDALLKIANLED